MRVLVAAGGTGGHLFPAEAVAHALVARGHEVALVTDRRAVPLVETFPGTVHYVPSATLKRRDPFAFARMGMANAAGLTRCLAIVARYKPAVAVGFGGYPTLPPLNAAWVRGVPVIVHEANAVMGRANRSLAKRAHVATSFPDVANLPAARSTTHVGIPVRQAVRDAARPYVPPAADEPFRLLVFGGSQGARVFAELIPEALEALGPDEKGRLGITMQARPEDLDRVHDWLGHGLAATFDVQPFFRDLPARMAAAHLVVSRSGASTVAELAVIGRPALLVPLPGARDQDQAHNAAALEALGGARTLAQATLTPQRLAAMLRELMAAPDRLAGMAAAATRLAKPDAAERLAALCETLAAPRAAELKETRA